MLTRILLNAPRLMSLLLLLLPMVADAQSDLGGSAEIQGSSAINEGDVRGTIRRLLLRAVSFVGLLAVVVIVIAGIYLIVGGGDDGRRETAKNMIIYTIIGIIVIALASAFVLFMTTIFA